MMLEIGFQVQSYIPGLKLTLCSVTNNIVNVELEKQKMKTGKEHF